MIVVKMAHFMFLIFDKVEAQFRMLRLLVVESEAADGAITNLP
jgi:hypothetical protein